MLLRSSWIQRQAIDAELIITIKCCVASLMSGFKSIKGLMPDYLPLDCGWRILSAPIGGFPFGRINCLIRSLRFPITFGFF